MKISNIIALTCIAVVGYMTYAMQPTERGESSAMAAARGEEQNIPTLQQKTAESIARQIHDEKKSSFMFYGDEVQLNEFPSQFRDLVAEAYYRLYPEEMAHWRLVQEIRGDGNSIKALPDGTFVSAIAYNELERRIERWRLQDDGTFQVSQGIAIENRQIGIAASSDGNLLAVGWTVPISVYGRGAGDQFVLLQGDILIGVARFNKVTKAIYNGPSGKTLVVSYTGADGRMRLSIFSWDNMNNRFELIQDFVDRYYDSISFNSTGDRFVAIRSSDDTLQIWSHNQDTGMFGITTDLGSESPAYAVFSPDDRYIAYTDRSRSNNTYRLVIKSITPQGAITELQNIPLQHKYYFDLKFSADSQQIALATALGVEVWQNINNNFKRIFTVPTGKTFKVALLKDDYLVSSQQRSLRIFKLRRLSTEEIWDHILLGLE